MTGSDRRTRSGMLKPQDVLREALGAQNRAELLIAWFMDVGGVALVFAFGDGATVTMPLTWLPPTIAQQVRDGLDPELTDFGQTIRFGMYEVANRALSSVFPCSLPGGATEILEACRHYVTGGDT
jgi:hypothetical protein